MSETKIGKVSITPKGTWDSTATYEQLDMVSYGGGSWIAKKTSTGVTPRENDCWMQAAEKGDKGDQGAAGSTTETAKASYIVPRATVGTLDYSTAALSAWDRGNKLAEIPPENIVVEYTVDGGETWKVYNATELEKRAVFSGKISSTGIPVNPTRAKHSSLVGMRMTISFMNFNVPDDVTDETRMDYWTADNYVSAERYVSFSAMYVIAEGSMSSPTLDITASKLGGSFDTIIASGVKIQSWHEGSFFPVYAFARYGGTKTQGLYAFLRFTLFISARNDTTTNYISHISAVNGNVWSGTSNQLISGTPYSIDHYGNVDFPKNLTVNGNLIRNGFKLIETITLADATKSITRSTAPDGTAYNYDALYILSVAPASPPSTDSIVSYQAFYSDGCKSYNYQPNAFSATANYATFQYVGNERGVVTMCGGGLGTYGVQTEANANVRYSKMVLNTATAKITSVKITVYGTNDTDGYKLYIYAC